MRLRLLGCVWWCVLGFMVGFVRVNLSTAQEVVDRVKLSPQSVAVSGKILSVHRKEEDVFVQLWKLDQQHSGLSVTVRGSDGRWENQNAGIGLDEQGMSLNPQIDSAPLPIMELLDDRKLRAATYQTIQPLFDNYQLRNGKPEDQVGDNPQEDAEVNAFIDAVVDTDVMKLCLKYINRNGLKPGGGEYSVNELKSLIRHQWFEIFTNHYSRPNPGCSGFEHVFVGDSDGTKIGGHHFWWKFMLDQKAGTADSLGHKYLGPAGERYPLLATFRMRWSPEPGSTLRDPIQKGFFVGCSPELMIAYGTLALLVEKKTDQHPIVTLEGGTFEMTVHASTLPGSGEPDSRRGDQIRTAYPKLISVAGDNAMDPSASLSVAAALATGQGKRVQVSGFIRDAHNDQFGLQLVDVDASDSTFLAVKLPRSFRSTYNPKLSASAKGKRVVLKGRREKYTGLPGIVDVTHIEFQD